MANGAALPARALSISAGDLGPFALEAASLAAGAVVAAFLGAGWLRRLSDGRLSLTILGLLVALGAALIVEGLIGNAGGEVIIPTLVFGFGAPIKAAGSLSLLISLPTVSVGLARYIWHGMLDRSTLRSVVLPMAAGSALGAVAGGLLVGLVPADALKLALGAALIWSAWRTLRHPKD